MNRPAPLFFLAILFAAAIATAQNIDLTRAAASCRPGGAARTPDLRDFGNGISGLECRAIFQPDNQKRASWDIPIIADLSQISAIKLRTFCRNPELVSQFSIYIKADSLWNSASFEISVNQQWEDIIIPKTRFKPETTHASWKNCDLLRIAAWKGAPGQFGLFIADIEFLRPNMSLALIRGNGNGKQKQNSESQRHAHNLNEALFLHGIMPAVIDENDLAFTTVRPYRMLLVPSPDSLSTNSTDTIITYIRSGGKTGLFHALSHTLAAQMDTPVGKFMPATSIPGAIGGIMPDNARLKSTSIVRQLSTSFIAVEVIPLSNRVSAWWMNCSGQRTRWPAIIETKAGFWMTHVYLNQDPYNGGRLLQALIAFHVPQAAMLSALTLMNHASNALSFATDNQNRTAAATQLAEAKRQYSAGNFQNSAYYSMRCQEALKESIGKTAPVRANEIRALWCRYPSGLPGHSWKQTLSLITDAGFNAVFPLAASPFFTAYPTRLTCQNPGEGLPECLAAARLSGTRVHAWMNCLGVEDAPETILLQWKREGRLQIGPYGNTLNWLCPNNPANRTLLTRLVSELLSKNNIEGIHFDRLRYPGRESCYCDNCKKAFSDFIGANPEPWPRFVRGGDYKDKWEAFRAASITSLFSALSSAALTAKSGTMVSAAVYPDCVQARASVGQDWATWCRNQWISFVCPMNYRASTTLFTGDLRRQINNLGTAARLIPGIGTGPERLPADELARQINAARSAGTPGFILFDLGQREAYELLPELKRMGITR